MLIVVLIMTFLISMTMMGCGYFMMKKPPKNINRIMGYRTNMSMKNKDTWEYAHKYSGNVWIISGIITLIISTILAIALQNLKNYNLYMQFLIYLEIIILLLVIPITEIKLRKVFDRDGNRKI